MANLVLLRHGESTWNRENRFTGWSDVDLTEWGCSEAKRAGKLLKAEGFMFDVAYTSLLKRAIRTLWIVLDVIDQMWVPVERSWRLNERHYGALQGLNKTETAKRYGEDKVQLWRRGYDVRPPALENDDMRNPANDPRYRSSGESDLLPLTESLKDTSARFLPYWEQTIAPAVLSGKRVLVAAHGNVFRALIKHLDGVSDEEIVGVNVPTAVPLVYELDDRLNPVRHYYLGDPEEIEKAKKAVADQLKAG